MTTGPGTLNDILEALIVLRYRLNTGEVSTQQAESTVAGITSALAQIIGQRNYDMNAHLSHMANLSNREETK